MNAWERAMEQGLGDRWAWIPKQTMHEVDSTNLRLKEWAREGKVSAPCLLVSDSQTAGRGRLGRAFVSPPGTGLYMSLLVSPPEHTDAGKITVLAAVAVCRAIQDLTGLRPKIKWVNDLFLRGKKVCGILAEGIPQGVIVGIGVNLKTPEKGFPPEAAVAGALDTDADRFLLAGTVSRYFLDGLERIDTGEAIAYYRANMPLIGQTIRCSENGQEKTVLVTGVADDGGLMIRDGNGPRTLRTGEVTLGSGNLGSLVE